MSKYFFQKASAFNFQNVKYHSMKSVRIRNYSGPHFPIFGLNKERYFVSHRIQSECGKIRTRKSPNTDTCYALCIIKENSFIIASLTRCYVCIAQVNVKNLPT